MSNRKRNKNTKIKIFIAWDHGYDSWLNSKMYERVYNVLEANIVMFTGGPDVMPSKYGEKRGNFTYFAEERDAKDEVIYNNIVKNNPKVFLIGVCRGAQYLTVKAGGSLFQDVTGHVLGDKTHNLDVENDFKHHINQDIIKATMMSIPMKSTHHQMMNPYSLHEDNYDLIASSDGALSAWYMNGDNKSHDIPKILPNMKEPEIVMYKSINALCIQGHPERLPENSVTVRFLNNLLIEEYNKSNKRNE